MTPRKGSRAHRSATVVYPGTSPELMLAYRIFGPGHENIANLDTQYRAIVGPQPEPAGSWERNGLTSRGQGIVSDLNIDQGQVFLAYNTYKMEIERMEKADRIHSKRKLAQCDGFDDESQGEADGDESDVLEVDDDGNDGVMEDPLAKYYKDPDLWLTRDAALAKQHITLLALRRMKGTIQDIQAFYAKKMKPSKDIDHAVEVSAAYLDKVINYGESIELIVKRHENKTPRSSWKSPDCINVTFGEKVPEVIHKIHELENRTEKMKPVLLAAKRVQAGLASTKLHITTQDLRVRLRIILIQFAVLCYAEDARAEVKKKLHEEATECAHIVDCPKTQRKKRAKAQAHDTVVDLLNE